MKQITLVSLLFIITNINAKSSNEEVNEVEQPEYLTKLFQHENIYIGPQPGYSDFDTIKKAGFSKVINMRTPDEMDNLEFYEDYLLQKAGIDYHLLPIGGEEYKYTPEKLQEFAESLNNNEGKVLLHCGSGHRASQLWAAYLVKYKGKTPDEALSLVSDMGWWPMPMELLLNKKLHVSIAE